MEVANGGEPDHVVGRHPFVSDARQGGQFCDPRQRLSCRARAPKEIAASGLDGTSIAYVPCSRIRRNRDERRDERAGGRATRSTRRRRSTAMSSEVLQASTVPVLVGGAYAMSVLHRHRPPDQGPRPLPPPRRLRAGRRRCSRRLDTPPTCAFPHWLGKALTDAWCVDLIFDSGNGLTHVDDEWFEHATNARRARRARRGSCRSRR